MTYECWQLPPHFMCAPWRGRVESSKCWSFFVQPWLMMPSGRVIEWMVHWWQGWQEAGIKTMWLHELGNLNLLWRLAKRVSWQLPTMLPFSMCICVCVSWHDSYLGIILKMCVDESAASVLWRVSLCVSVYWRVSDCRNHCVYVNVYFCYHATVCAHAKLTW